MAKGLFVPEMSPAPLVCVRSRVQGASAKPNVIMRFEQSHSGMHRDSSMPCGVHSVRRLESLNPWLHVGVHEFPSGSAAVQSPTPPSPGGADASHENVTDAAVVVGITTRMPNATTTTKRAHTARDER